MAVVIQKYSNYPFPFQCHLFHKHSINGLQTCDRKHICFVTLTHSDRLKDLILISISHFRCIFDPAAVARNVQQGGGGGFFEFEDDEENIFSVSSIITIVSISVALILAIIIIIVVMKHRQMRDKLLRSRKLSRVTGGGVMSRVSASGVKVLPDYLFSPTPVDESECKVTGPQFAPNIFLRFTEDLKNIKCCSY